MIILQERNIPPVCFEYRTAFEQNLVTVICKAEVTEPRKGKDIYNKIYMH